MILQIIGAVVSLAFAVFIIYVVLEKNKLEYIKQRTVSILNQYGLVHVEGKKIYFTTSKHSYQILFFRVPTNGELTINSKTMWEIIDSGTSKMIDQSIFLATEKPKLVMIYPTTHVIKRYINENEMVFVKPTDSFYEMNLIRTIELEEVLKEGIL
ncbi:MAG: hypothetical protein KKH01_06545 [Firmicutes bacterium]|nr:hypothetical protein [Bacillota bacterium]